MFFNNETYYDVFKKYFLVNNDIGHLLETS